MKIVIPVEQWKGAESVVAQHFGRAPFFAVADLGRDGAVEQITMVENTGEHLGGRISVENLVGNMKPDALIVRGMGPRGLNAFQSQGVAVFTGDLTTVERALEDYVKGRLRGLTEACREARHRF